MQFSPETNRGLDILRKIIERTEVLSLAEPIRINGGNAFILVISANGKETDFCLSREQLDDTPATPGYREAAEAFARSLDARFQNVDPNYFVSSSGRLLSISPEWPALPLMAPGGGLRAAMGVRVPVKDVLTEEIAICHVVITHSQTFPSRETTPYHRLPAIINSIRAEVDNGNVLFYSAFEQHPKIMQNVDFRYDARPTASPSVSQYLQQKVWSLGFRAGQKSTRVWIADPLDAAYLGHSVARLRQEAAILDAQGFLQSGENEEFANTGKALLAQHGPKTTPVSAPTTTPPASEKPQTEFDVFISHSTADKPYVEPLAEALQAAGISVWFDKKSMEWGDSLRSEIDRGLAACCYGIVVFSKAFLNKRKWTEHELNALFAREELGKKVILPIWHGISREDLLQYSPAFADRLAKNSIADSYADIVQSLLTMLERPAPAPGLAGPASSKATDSQRTKTNAIVHARYEAKGTSLLWVHAYIRPVPDAQGQFTFESTEGGVEQGDQEFVALEFFKLDRALKTRGYTRIEFENLSGNHAFDF